MLEKRDDEVNRVFAYCFSGAPDFGWQREQLKKDKK
jgi:hypothetical protein